MNVNIKTTKIATELSWLALKFRFYTLDLLEKAIADGTLSGMIQQNADTMYGGDTTEVVKAIRRNLSSKATNYRKAATISAECRDDFKRYELLWNYTGILADALIPVRGTASPSSKAKAAWLYDMEEINSIADDDIKTLKYVYDGMMSKKSKNPEAIEKATTMEEFLGRLSVVSLRKSAAEKMLDKQKTLSSTLLAKLNKGAKVTLSADELAEVRSLLGK